MRANRRSTAHQPVCRPAARLASKVGTAGFLALGVFACTALSSCRTVDGHDDTFRHTYAGVQRVVVTAGPGDVRLLRSTGPDVQVTLSRHWTSTAPDAKPAQSGDLLTIRSTCGDQAGDAVLGDCTVDAEVTVPVGATVVVRSVAGSVTATELDVSSFDARVQAGDVTASFDSAPDSIRAESSAGSLTLSVPSTSYRVDAGTDLGGTRVDVVEDPGSARSIYAHTEVGDVRVARL